MGIVTLFLRGEAVGTWT